MQASAFADKLKRFGHWVAIHGDGIIAFSTGDVTRLLEDAQVLKPVHMAGVPRVYNRCGPGIYRCHVAD